MDLLSTYRHAIAGAGGGLVTVVLLHPFDTVKTRLQALEGARQYHGGGRVGGGVSLGGFLYGSATFQEIRRICRLEGFRALYKGVFPAMFGGSLSWAFYFQWFHFVKDRLVDAGFHQSPGLHLFAGTTAGVITCLLTNPIWVIKTRLQLQVDTTTPTTTVRTHAVNVPVAQKPAPYRSAFGGIMTILRDDGFRGLYRGVGPSLWLVSHGAIHFATYEEIKKVMKGGVDGGSLGVAQSLLASTVSKLVASTATYPLQVVRTRMQQRSADFSSYGSLWRTVSTIASAEGARGFYKGLVANVFRVTPSAAVTFVTYEQIIRLLGKEK